MKLSKAQEKVITEAKERIDFARNHSFCDWWRHDNGCYLAKNKKHCCELTDAEVFEEIERRTAEGWVATLEREMKQYEGYKNGTDYRCHASSVTIRKLESLGLIEIIYDSAGENYGFDTIKILNY